MCTLKSRNWRLQQRLYLNLKCVQACVYASAVLLKAPGLTDPAVHRQKYKIFTTMLPKRKSKLKSSNGGLSKGSSRQK